MFFVVRIRNATPFSASSLLLGENIATEVCWRAAEPDFAIFGLHESPKNLISLQGGTIFLSAIGDTVRLDTFKKQSFTISRMKYGLGYSSVTRFTAWLARTVFYYRRAEIRRMVDSLEGKENIRILDYGCNTAYLLGAIRRRYPQKPFDLCGADINRHALAYCRKKYPDCTFFQADEKFFRNERFDVIFLSHVLEHVCDRKMFLKGITRILKKNGTLIIAIPQERIRGDCTIPQLLYNVCRGRFENPHVVKMDYQQLLGLLKTYGFMVKKHSYTHFLYPFISSRKRLDAWSLIVQLSIS